MEARRKRRARTPLSSLHAKDLLSSKKPPRPGPLEIRHEFALGLQNRPLANAFLIYGTGIRNRAKSLKT
jgi:hypothetical protein